MMPIPVPHFHREVPCIIHNGVRYCQASDITRREVGIGIGVMVAYFILIAWAMHLWEDKGKPITAACMVLGPIAALVMWMVFS